MEKRNGLKLADELEMVGRVAEELAEVAELLQRRAQRAQRLLVEYGSGGSGTKAA